MIDLITLQPKLSPQNIQKIIPTYIYKQSQLAPNDVLSQAKALINVNIFILTQ